MRLNYNQFLAVVYGELFDWPLNEKEARLWAISNKIQDTRYKVQKRRQNEELLRLRKEREKISITKRQKAIQVAETLQGLPTVQGIFLTGSVAVGSAKEDADIDLMIVTSPGTLWLTRLIVVSVLKTKGIYRDVGINRNLLAHKDKICPNIFLDMDNLGITEKNLYTAHEVLQAEHLFDRGGIEKRWLKENGWAEAFLPNAYRSQKSKVKSQNYKLKVKGTTKNFWILTWIFRFCILPFERLAFIAQYFYMRPKITNEKVGLYYAFFHPQDLSEEVLAAFERRLAGKTPKD